MSAYSDLVRLDAPIGYWVLDEASGTDFADSSGGSHALIGSIDDLTRVPGPFGADTAIQLSGGTLAQIRGTGPAWASAGARFSIECWCLLISGGWGSMLYWGDGSEEHFVMAEINASAGGLDVFGGQGGDFYNDDPREGLDLWHHYGLTWDGTVGRLYIDGSPVSATAPSTAWGSNSAVIAPVVVLGNDAGQESPLHAALAHMAFYDRALTPCQVRSHYDLATTGSYTPCRPGVRLMVNPDAGTSARLRVHAGGGERLVIHG